MALGNLDVPLGLHGIRPPDAVPGKLLSASPTDPIHPEGDHPMLEQGIMTSIQSMVQGSFGISRVPTDPGGGYCRPEGSVVYDDDLH
jgi:hypothetical protein